MSQERESRFLPFRRVEPFVDVLPGADLDAQRRAVADDHRATLCRAAIRPFWLVALGAAAGGSALVGWSGVVAAGVGWLAGTVLLVLGGMRLRRRVRAADETIGIPMCPDDDDWDGVFASAATLGQIAEEYEIYAGIRGSTMGPALRRYRARVEAADQQFVAILHQLRKAWLDNDRARYRDLLDSTATTSRRLRELLAAIMDDARRPSR